MMMLACLFSKVFIDALLLWPWQWIIQPWEKWATEMLPGGEHGASSCWDDASECSQTHPGCTPVRGGKGRLGRLKQKPSGCIPELEKTCKNMKKHVEFHKTQPKMKPADGSGQLVAVRRKCWASCVEALQRSAAIGCWVVLIWANCDTHVEVVCKSLIWGWVKIYYLLHICLPYLNE